MNREIKFKAKLRDYSDWVCGYYEKVGEHHFITASDEVAYLIDPATICQLITKIVDVEIYEYDCYFRKSDDMGYYFDYYFYEDGILYTQTVNVILDVASGKCYLKIIEDKILVTGHINYPKYRTFIGNWHDGEEYLLSKIKEVKQ
jgi:hypothetical protein